mmetsp:Transcript_31645/g.67016  ORF Transcript_31645/g.67016 Transcript_31645/m.67016 type:complete len:190 (-) Transcript_31645:141-710(-)
MSDYVTSNKSFDASAVVHEADAIQKKSKDEDKESCIDDFTIQDLLSVFPERLTSGTAFWIRCGGPVGKKEFQKCMCQRPERNTHAISGWKCGVAVVVEMKTRAGQWSSLSDIERKLHRNFREYIPEFMECVMSKGERVKLDIIKPEDDKYFVMIPKSRLNDAVERWAMSPWPRAKDGSIVASGCKLSLN